MNILNATVQKKVPFYTVLRNMVSPRSVPLCMSVLENRITHNNNFSKVYSSLSSMFWELVCPLHETAGYMRKTQKLNTKSGWHGFVFNSCVRIYLGDIGDWWMKDFAYIYCNVITFTVMACVWGRKMAVIASGGWENCRIADNHMYISKLSLNYKNGKYSLKVLVVG